MVNKWDTQHSTRSYGKPLFDTLLRHTLHLMLNMQVLPRLSESSQKPVSRKFQDPPILPTYLSSAVLSGNETTPTLPFLEVISNR